MADEVLVTRRGNVVLATINRERARNALNDAALNQLMALFRDTVHDGTRAIVLTGAGTKAFSAGSDIKEMAAQTPEQRVFHTELGQRLAETIEQHPALTLAAIEGYCLGGGLEVSLAFDTRVVAEGCRLGLPELRINALPSWGGMARLPRLIGFARAKEIILLGRQITANEAVAWGLAAEVVPAGGAVARALEIAADVTGACTARTFSLAKSVVTFGLDAAVRSAVHMELLADLSTVTSQSFDQGVAGFTAKKT